MRFSSDLLCCIQSLLLLPDTFISASATRLPQKVTLLESASPVNSANATEDFAHQPFIRQHTNLEIQEEEHRRAVFHRIYMASLGILFFFPK